MSFEEEQNEIWETSKKLDMLHGREWFKYKGDVINRIIIRLLGNHVRGYNVVGPSAFIEGVPTEFDILIIRENSTPLADTNAFQVEDVKIIIEIKKHGFYYKKIEGEDKIREYFQQLENTNKPFLYITVKESRKFIRATRNVLGDKAFFIGVSHGSQRNGEWKKFVEKVLDIL